jgi:hypothetical protein
MADIPAPDRDAMRSLAASLGDRANAMAAEGRAAEVPALWQDAIAGLADEGSRALITLAFAWYQALHGEAEHGVRLAAGLRDCPWSPVRAQVRVLVRNRMRVEPEVAAPTWRAVVGTAVPGWAQLADADIDHVAEWISAASWKESKELFENAVSRIAPQDADYALEELALGDPRLRSAVSVHRAVLGLGGDAGYRCLSDPREAARVATASIAMSDWDGLRACALIEVAVHGQAFLGGVHGVAAELMAGGDTTVSPAMAERVATLARDAQPWERRQAVADLGAIGDASVLTLVGSVPDSQNR